MRVWKFFLFIFLIFPCFSYAGVEPSLPHFASIKSGEANIRTGPGKRYPIKWEVARKNIPVEVLSEFEQWRKIRDVSGDEGWIHQNMLGSTRFVITQSAQIIRRSDSQSSRAVAKLEPGVAARLKTCTSEWCKVEVADTTGWVLRSSLWGIYPHEVFQH